MSKKMRNSDIFWHPLRLCVNLFLTVMLALTLLGIAACDDVDKDKVPEDVTYTVTFNANAVGAFPARQTVKVTLPETTVSELPPNPARVSHTFESWNTQSNGNGTPFTTSTIVTENINVYAQWSGPVERPDVVEPSKYSGQTSVSHHGGPLILVHYMPWYRGPSNKSEEDTLSKYGGHWTRWGNKDPTETVPLEDGSGNKAIIHAKQYPLTGPYHSSNPDLLEYQAGLFKIAGIDGALFDWYGAYDRNDFGENNRYTTAMVDVLRRANLQHAVVYEDNTLNMMNMNGEEAWNVGKFSFDWAQEQWFYDDPLYVRYEGRPVVMCFGPQKFDTKEQWDFVFSGTNPMPYFVDLDNRYNWSDASFNWFNYGRGSTQSEQISDGLDSFMNRQKNKSVPFRTVTVFSAFEDDYLDVGTAYRVLDYADGAIFDLTWKKATEDFDPAIIQIATWNDYGEGTIIEPTIERGYNELEYIQDRVKEYLLSFPFNKEDLRWPLEFYKLRYTQTATADQEAAIAAAIEALFTGDAATFRSEAAKIGVTIDMEAPHYHALLR